MSNSRHDLFEFCQQSLDDPGVFQTRQHLRQAGNSTSNGPWIIGVKECLQRLADRRVKECDLFHPPKHRTNEVKPAQFMFRMRKDPGDRLDIRIPAIRDNDVWAIAPGLESSQERAAIPFAVGRIDRQMQRTAGDTVHGHEEIPGDAGNLDVLLIHRHLTGDMQVLLLQPTPPVG